MKHQIFTILVNEPDIDAYVLSDCALSVERARDIMQLRAEELVDELVAGDVEYERGSVGEYLIVSDDDRMNISIVDTEFEVVRATLNIQVACLVDPETITIRVVE